MSGENSEQALFNLTETIFEEDVFSELDYNKEPIVRIIASLLLFLLMLFGFFGNLALIHIVTNKWKVQTPFNLFVANIAFADAWTTLSMTCVLTTHMFFGEFFFGETVCKLTHFIDYSMPMVSILSVIAALALLQFEVVGFRISAVAIAGIYIITMPIGVITARYASIFESETIDSEETVSHCMASFPTEQFQTAMEVAGSFFHIGVPALYLLICLINWIVEKWTNERIFRGFAHSKLLMVMTVVSLVAWTLSFNVWMISELPYATVYVLMFIAHASVGFSIAIKPILYALMHEGFRRELQKIVGWESGSPERSQFF